MARLFQEVVNGGKKFDDVIKFNPYHDRLGRFTNVGGATSFTWKPGASSAHDKSVEREKKRMADSDNKAAARVVTMVKPGNKYPVKIEVAPNGMTRITRGFSVTETHQSMDEVIAEYKKTKYKITEGSANGEVVQAKPVDNKKPKEAKKPEIDEKKRQAKIDDEKKPSGADGCKSVREIQDKMMANGWFTSRARGIVDIESVDLDAAKAIYGAYEQVFNRYPQLKGQFGAISVREMRPNEYAACAMKSGQIQANKKYFADSKKFARIYEKDEKAGFHPKGTDWRCSITHEIGHAIDGYLSQRGVNGSNLNRKNGNPMSASMLASVNRATKTSVKDIGKTVSKYATQDSFEWFAECFAEFMTSPAPRPVATEFGKQLDTIMKGVK